MFGELNDDLESILKHTAGLWDRVKDKTIFISGGTGFFGIWMQLSFIHINRKLGLNSKLILLTRNKHRFLFNYPWLNGYNEIEFIEGDITNFEFISDKVDYIIHAATEASVKLNLEEPLTMFDTVVNGTRRILEFAKLKEVESFLLTSSGAVYGNQPSSIEHTSEDYLGAPLTFDPGSVYGEGKRMAEVLCSVYHKHYNLPVKIARCYAFVGPFLPLDGTFAIGNFIKNLLDDKVISIEGDGTPYRSYMYASDLMIWLWTILFKGEDNRPYNVGSDQAISIKDLAASVARENTSGETKIDIKTPELGRPPHRYVPSILRIQKELGLKIYINLNEGIQKTIAFYKNEITE
ncbi:MAG: NAD-dependent epimerase/dehydratase family protein [Pedobacter agri]